MFHSVQLWDDFCFLIHPQSHRAKFYISFGCLMLCVRSRAWQEWRLNGSCVWRRQTVRMCDVIRRFVFKLHLFLNLRFKKSMNNALQGNHFWCDLEHKYKTQFSFKLRCQWMICGQNHRKLVTATERVVDQNGFMRRSLALQVFINIGRFSSHFQQNSNVNKPQMTVIYSGKDGQILVYLCGIQPYILQSGRKSRETVTKIRLIKMMVWKKNEIPFQRRPFSRFFNFLCKSP